MKEREIWFVKFLGSYFPCHWKGWAFIFVLVVLQFLMMGVASIVITAIGRKDLDFLIFAAPFSLLLILSWVIAERHS